MITCQQLIDFLDEYVSGAMDAPRRKTLDEHIAVCPDCVNYVDSYRKTIELGKAALSRVDSPAPADVPVGLVKAVLSALPRKS